MQNNEFQTLSQGYYAKLLIYFDLGSGQIRRIRVIYEVAQNVICSDSMCNEYCEITEKTRCRANFSAHNYLT